MSQDQVSDQTDSSNLDSKDPKKDVFSQTEKEGIVEIVDKINITGKIDGQVEGTMTAKYKSVRKYKPEIDKYQEIEAFVSVVNINVTSERYVDEVLEIMLNELEYETKRRGATRIHDELNQTRLAQHPHLKKIYQQFGFEFVETPNQSNLALKLLLETDPDKT